MKDYELHYEFNLALSKNFTLFLVCFNKLPNRSGHLRKFNSIRKKIIFNKASDYLVSSVYHLLQCTSKTLTSRPLTINDLFPINLVTSLDLTFREVKKKRTICILYFFSVLSAELHFNKSLNSTAESLSQQTSIGLCVVPR